MAQFATMPRQMSKRRRPTGESRYGFQTLAVGQWLFIQAIDCDRHALKNRVAVKAWHWHHREGRPERFRVELQGGGVRVTRVA
ncbi:MAG: hypothetical protein AB7K86_08555 [Rhodospirillales bacterium]